MKSGPFSDIHKIWQGVTGIYKKNKKAQKPTFWADLLALILITTIGGLMHFTWEKVEGISALRWTAVLFPVNESNWEHVKMAAWPLLIWSLIVLARDGWMKIRGWLMPAALCICSAYAVMFTVHAAMPLAFGELGLVQYVGSFMLGIAHGIMAFRVSYRSSSAGAWWFIGLLLLAAMFAMVIAFTYYPPRMPLFMESSTGMYGIID